MSDKESNGIEAGAVMYHTCLPVKSDWEKKLEALEALAVDVDDGSNPAGGLNGAVRRAGTWFGVSIPFLLLYFASTLIILKWRMRQTDAGRLDTLGGVEWGRFLEDSRSSASELLSDSVSVREELSLPLSLTVSLLRTGFDDFLDGLVAEGNVLPGGRMRVSFVAGIASRDTSSLLRDKLGDSACNGMILTPSVHSPRAHREARRVRETLTDCAHLVRTNNSPVRKPVCHI